MDAAVYVSFVLTSILLALAPGPDNLFVLMQSATFGALSGLWVVAGLITGLAAQTVLAAAGVGAAVAASPALFWAIRIAGAAYLVYLAVGAWRSGAGGGARAYETRSASKLWLRGFVMNVTNPKVQIFFLAFFPQFVSRGAAGLQTACEMLVLGATFMAATALVFGGLAVTAGKLADRLRSDRVQMILNRTSAVLFVGLAAAALVD